MVPLYGLVLPVDNNNNDNNNINITNNNKIAIWGIWGIFEWNALLRLISNLKIKNEKIETE